MSKEFKIYLENHDTPIIREILNKATNTIEKKLAGKIDAEINLVIKAKPKYMPSFLYRWLLSRIIIKHHQSKITYE